MLTLADVERAIANRDPTLGEVLVRYLDQSDPDAGRSELTADDYDDDDEDDDSLREPEVDVPSGAFTIYKLRSEVTSNLHGKNPTERKLARREAFAAAEASPFAPPRLRLGKILVALYDQGDPAARAALIHVFTRGNMKWGVWYAAKQIYKRAEAEHDAAMFGALAYRFDAMTSTSYVKNEIGGGTLLYLRRRAWRYLRQLGKAAQDAYPAFAVEVLRHYPAGHGGWSSNSSWVAAHIWGHGNMRYARSSGAFSPPTHGDPMAARAYAAAWKLTPAPLLRLLETSENDTVCDWAIRSLRADHALALRAVEPAWLARLGRRSVGAIHAFVVALLRESPELHQSKLRELGLHDVVIGFLRSSSDDARTYALEYAAAHGSDIPAEQLVGLVEDAEEDVQKFASARLEAMPGAKIGVTLLLRLLGNDAAAWAGAKLAQAAKPSEVTVAQFIDTAMRSDEAFEALHKFYGDGAIPPGYWTAFLDDKRVIEDSWQYSTQTEKAWEELGKKTAREIGIAWIQRALEISDHQDNIETWLDEGKLSGPDLDIEWLKGLVGKPRVRRVALRLLADRRHVAPARVGLTWLLDLARSPDETIAQFAQRMLLESFEPEDFAQGAGGAVGGGPSAEKDDRAKGVARLWELAAGKKSPETVRAFAATYLKAHHPELNKRSPEAKSLGITPRLGPEAFAMDVVRPLANDDRVDVRRLACAIIGEELVRWGDQDLVYELAGAQRAEPRGLGGELLLGTLVEGNTRRVPAAWLDGRRLFQLAESGHKAAREVALTLIRRLYEQVGGAERLAWLMDSPERDVRLFAVRLFWDRHRPKPWPADYAPRKKHDGAAIGTDRFADLTSLRQFARVVLFGLPPGRVGERDPLIEGAPKPERALPASIAKRRLIEAMRDVGLEDVELAKAIMPILGEFAESTAKGEWQASVQALTALRATHKEAIA